MKSKIYENGTKVWKLPNGLLHRQDGPAVKYGGNEAWYINGLRHREDGPAVKYGGDKYWYINDKRHREDGSAIEYANGDKDWYLNGYLYTEQEYKVKMRSKKLKLLL